MKHILVTGGNGFIGSSLLAKLHGEAEILDRKRFPLNDPGKLVKILKQKKVIVHLAGKTRGTLSELFDANTLGTLGVLQAIANIKVKPKLIFASSFAVYSPQSGKLEESSITIPEGDYGLTKLLAEKEVLSFAKRFGFPALILRFSNIYGAGMPPFSHSVVSTFFEQVKEGIPLTINGNGRQARDFVYIDDLLDALIKAINQKIKPGEVEIVNICSGKEVSMNNLAKEIEKITSKKIKINYNLSGVKERGYWIGSNRKAEEILKWKSKMSLKEGLKKTYYAKNQV